MKMHRCFPVVSVMLLYVLLCALPATAVDVCANATMTVRVTLVRDPTSGSCTQNGSSQPIDVKQGQCVVYSAGSQPFEVLFRSSKTPFYDFKSANGDSVTTGPAAGKVNHVYNYKSVTVNGQPCSGGSSLGLIMK